MWSVLKQLGDQSFDEDKEATRNRFTLGGYANKRDKNCTSLTLTYHVESGIGEAGLDRVTCAIIFYHINPRCRIFSQYCIFSHYKLITQAWKSVSHLMHVSV